MCNLIFLFNRLIVSQKRHKKLHLKNRTKNIEIKENLLPLLNLELNPFIS